MSCYCKWKFFIIIILVSVYCYYKSDEHFTFINAFKAIFKSKTTAFSDDAKPSRIANILRIGKELKVNKK